MTVDLDRIVADYARDESALRTEVEQVLVGQATAVDEVLVVLFAGGHALVQGVPGTGKTLLVRTLARTAGLDFGRIQFTPDLLPADILGCETLLMTERGGESITFSPGPVFTQFLLADEINRGTPRTQSALLEAMQEGQVTVAGERRALDPLFTVFATRNPIEMEGTYPLPEAQLDRFLLEVNLPTPDRAAMVEIARRTTGVATAEVKPMLSRERLHEIREQVRQVIVADDLMDRAARWIEASQPTAPGAPAVVQEGLRYGAGVRALQALILCAKVEALRQGRPHVAGPDLERYLLPVTRHRFLLSLDGEARGVTPEEICEEIIRRCSAG